MKKPFSYLSKTSFQEIAEDLDDLPLYYQLYFSTLDPDELKEFNLDPYEYYIIEKVHFNFQSSEEYSVLIRYMDGSKVELKGIDILSEGNIDDYDLRQYGIRMFLIEYCEKHVKKNSKEHIYYFYFNE